MSTGNSYVHHLMFDCSMRPGFPSEFIGTIRAGIPSRTNVGAPEQVPENIRAPCQPYDVVVPSDMHPHIRFFNTMNQIIQGHHATGKIPPATLDALSMTMSTLRRACENET